MTNRMNAWSAGDRVSEAESARIDAEARRQDQDRHSAVKAIASACTSADECRGLLEMLGLGEVDVRAAREELAAGEGGQAKSSAA